MKLFLSIVFIISALFLNYAYADDVDEKYNWSTSIGTSGLFLRNSLNDKHSLFYGISYSLYKSESKTDNFKDEYIDLEIGHRYYFDKSSIQTFLDSSISYAYNTGDQVDKAKYYSLNVLYGLEHLITKNFSVEGAAGLAIRYTDYNNVYDDTNIYLYAPAVRVAVNYYF